MEAVIKLKNSSFSNKLGRTEFNDFDSDVSPTVKCDPKAKYRRIDGKCNNLMNTNWGSSFHRQRRLLPPNYGDGISQLRTAANGAELPNPRLLTKTLLAERPSLSKLSTLQTLWGQFIAHDTFCRIIYLGGGVDCCRSEGRHSECIPIEGFPKDNLTIAYKQNCINLIRTITGNTRNLGISFPIKIKL